MLCLCRYSFPSIPYPSFFLSRLLARSFTLFPFCLLPLPIFCCQPCQCFKMTHVLEKAPLPDLWHCLLHQLPCPSLINFDVEPNEIRPTVEAVADSCSFMPVCCIAEPHWLMRGEGESSSLHQPRRSAALSLHSETLHIRAHMAIKRKPNILQEFGKQEQTLHCLTHVIFAWLMAALGFNGHVNCWSILVCVLTEAFTLIYSSSI